VGQPLRVDLTARRTESQPVHGPGHKGVNGPNDCNGQVTGSTYYASGVPVTPGSSGARAFATNESMTIWQNTNAQGAAPPAEPFAIAPGIGPLQ
jgi:hypothetical protein